MYKNKVYLILIWTAVFLMLASIIVERGNTFTLQKMAAAASQRLAAKAVACTAALIELRGHGAVSNEIDGYYVTQNIALYLFRGDSLFYWNNSQVPVRSKFRFKKEQGITRLNHGYYLYFKKNYNDTSAIALCLLKPDYKLRNNYLDNDFKKWTGISADVKIDTTLSSGNEVLLNGEKLFSLSGNEDHYYRSALDNVSLIFFITGFVLLLTGILLKIHLTLKTRTFIILTGAVIALRLLMIFFKWPFFLYRTGLYDVHLFGNAQSWANGYLGDILFNAFVLLFVASATYMRPQPAKNKNAAKFFGLPVLIFLLVNQYNSSMVSLVSNSTLNFDFLNIFNITWPALIALMAVSLYSVAIFVAVKKYTHYFARKNRNDLVVFITACLLICVAQHIVSRASVFENYWLLVFAVGMYVLLKFWSIQLSIALGLQIILMSAITSGILNKYIDKNQKQDLEILSITLGETKDPVLESEFSILPARIKADESLRNLINILPSTSESIQQLLYQKYFIEYFNRYYVEFCLFDAKCTPLLEPNNAVLLNEGYWEDQVNYYSDSTSVENLFFVKGHKQNSRYIGRITLGDKRLYIQMEPKQFEELGSFPDLLLDRSQQRHEKLKNFSYAVYLSNQNTSHYGNYNYPIFLPDSVTLTGSDPGFIHHFFNVDANTSIIISRTAHTWMYFFTFNSYLLLFFSLVTYCCYLVYAFLFTSVFARSSLTRRIQTIIILLLLVAMSAIGFTSTKLVINQFESENRKQLREKTEIIINELLLQFKSTVLFEPSQKELVNLKLNEYARLFNTDISLFDKAGYLYNTSQPRLYNLGLAASLANPHALFRLNNNLSSAVAINEKAGNLSYSSLYTPLFDGSKNLVGFINLPYFARQNDLVNELSGIISALINVYVILFVISILGGLIFSGYITKPLRLIQQQIANITLGKQNEKITWQSNDEIGTLIHEYNEMLAKLERSASLLAQSEREGAWREMAKQVAHEIKNPLTPMKLNLQYLQHLMKNDPEAFNEKFEKASAGIIEQINSLANIANEFSNFAKLPGTLLQTINLAEVINTSLLLFENEKNVLLVNNINEPEILVKGDRDQCMRVFNNVLKNAVQAMESTENAAIEISCEIKDLTVIVAVKDNGPGIDADLRERIFTPNFTTKTTGSGLGLAMVKNIMLGLGGEIWFESGNNGTTFFLQFMRV